MLRDVLLPRATRYPAQKFPARTIKLLWAHGRMPLQKKQLIEHYFEHVFITKEKKGQAILRNLMPNIFPDSACL